MSSGNWMFGGGGDESPRTENDGKKKSYLNREWNDENNSVFQIGASNDKESAFRNKRLAQLAYQQALNADRQKFLAKKQEDQNTNRGNYTQEQSGGILQIGTKELDLRASVKKQLAANKIDVAARIAEESSPINSPRNRRPQTIVQDGANEVEFCIGENEALMKQRKAAQKLIYLQQLDADTGNSRTSAKNAISNRDYDYVSTGITGLQIGSGKPSLDMSPSMKNLHADAKKAKAAEYRQFLAMQQEVALLAKAERAAASAAANSATSEPLPYMRY